MKKWKCPNCGDVEPEVIMDSCPAQATCPKCGRRIEDGEGIRIIEDEEMCVRLRPEFYKKTHPEIYKKYFDRDKPTEGNKT